MSISHHFSLPYIGMKDGFHRYTFNAGNDFFAAFPSSPIKDGLFEIVVDIDKRQGLSELTIDVKGHVAAICDRCLAEIKLPAKGIYHILVKVGNDTSDDDEVIFIRDDQSHLDLAQVIYEFICLSLPLVNIYDCENEVPPVCNDEILNKLKHTSESTEEEQKNESIWDSLKNLNTDI
jgi:uncharacterized protein